MRTLLPFGKFDKCSGSQGVLYHSKSVTYVQPQKLIYLALKRLIASHASVGKERYFAFQVSVAKERYLASYASVGKERYMYLLSNSCPPGLAGVVLSKRTALSHNPPLRNSSHSDIVASFDMKSMGTVTSAL